MSRSKSLTTENECEIEIDHDIAECVSVVVRGAISAQRHGTKKVMVWRTFIYHQESQICEERVDRKRLYMIHAFQGISKHKKVDDLQFGSSGQI
jgi:hypothetical protein